MEGACNYIASQILASLPLSAYRNDLLMSLASNPDPIYGAGYRKVSSLAKDLGNMENFLAFIANNSDFPSFTKKDSVYEK